MFNKIIQFFNGGFAITDTVKTIQKTIDEVRQLSVDDAINEANEVINNEDLFEIVKQDQTLLMDNLPQHARKFLAVYSYIICLRNGIEINIALFSLWGADSNYLKIGESPDGIILLLELSSEHVLESDSSQEKVNSNDMLPTIFHWIVLQNRLNNIDIQTD